MLTLAKKIIVAIDGSPQSDKAAEEAVRLAAVSGPCFKSQVYALAVLPGTEAPAGQELAVLDSTVLGADLDVARRQLYYVVEKSAREAGVRLQCLAAYGDPAGRILQLAQEKECDVIVIGSSGKGRVRRALLGSVSTEVALRADISVYIVR